MNFRSKESIIKRLVKKIKQIDSINLEKCLSDQEVDAVPSTLHCSTRCCYILITTFSRIWHSFIDCRIVKENF